MEISQICLKKVPIKNLKGKINLIDSTLKHNLEQYIKEKDIFQKCKYYTVSALNGDLISQALDELIQGNY